MTHKNLKAGDLTLMINHYKDILREKITDQ